MTLQPVRLVGPVGLRGLIGVVEGRREAVPHRGGLDLGHDPLGDQPLGIERARRFLPLDLAVHHRLGEGRLVGLVVAVAAVADDVEHDVGAELQPELGRHPGTEHHRVQIVAVDVQDRHLHRFRDVGAIEAGIGVRGQGGEADLVIHHHVDGAAGAVADELAHRQRLIDETLARERRVAVHHDAHDAAPAAGVARHVLPRAHLADHHRIDRLQMRRIGLQRDMHRRAADLDIGRGAEMVFHVARTLHVVGLEAGAAELAEHGGERLAHDVDQRVEPAAMRHPDHDLA